MKCWVFIVKDHVQGKEVIPASKIAEERVRERFWLVSKRVAAMKELGEGGVAVFYSTGREGKLFLGDGTFSQPAKPITNKLRFHIRGYPSEKLTHYVAFDTATLWPKPVSLQSVVDKISFIKKKDKSYAYFRGSVRKIPNEDFLLIKSIGQS